MEKNWKKLPIGTVLVSKPGQIVETLCEFFTPVPGIDAPDLPHYVIRDKTTGTIGRLEWVNEDEEDDWRLTSENFADAYRRDELAKAGFFSIDDPAKVERTRCEREALAAREAAFRRAGLDRDVILDRLSAFLENRTDGIWATSTLDYAQRRRKLDEAFLAAFGSNQ